MDNISLKVYMFESDDIEGYLFIWIVWEGGGPYDHQLFHSFLDLKTLKSCNGEVSEVQQLFLGFSELFPHSYFNYKAIKLVKPDVTKLRNFCLTFLWQDIKTQRIIINE